MNSTMAAKALLAICICPPVAYMVTPAPQKKIIRHHTAKQLRSVANRIEKKAVIPQVPCPEILPPPVSGGLGGLGEPVLSTPGLGENLIPDGSLYPPNYNSAIPPRWFDYDDVFFGSPGFGGGIVRPPNPGLPITPPAPPLIPDTPVPEPSTWLSLLVGFTIVGVAARRKNYARS